MFYTDDFMRDVMGITEFPETLYHYTSIDNLALLLANQTLMFSRLDGVNDPEEAYASDFDNAATLVFASCWTELEKESLAMWRMYTPDMQGVRIKMPSNPFLGRSKLEIYSRGGIIQSAGSTIEINRANNGIGINSYYISGPNKIYYSDAPQYRELQCIEKVQGKTLLSLHDLGMFKNTYWEFEQEWRYKILATISERVLDSELFKGDPVLDLDKHPVIEQKLFVPLDATSFDEMEILLGPRTTNAHELIVNSLIKTYAPKASISKSKINVR